MDKVLVDLLKRAERWPDFAQKELVQLAEAIEGELEKGSYRASEEELRALDEADLSGVASEEEIDAAFGKFRGA